MIHTKVLRIFIILILFFVSIEMFKNHPNCGTVNWSSKPKSSQFIVGGKDANITQFPFMANLQVNSSHRCGATIINEEWILTAAHCLKKENIKSQQIKVGITSPNETVESHNVFEPKIFVIHGCTDSDGDDILLIKTDRPIVQIDTDPKIKAICLPVANSFPSNKKLFHTGWGVFVKHGKREPSVLLQMAETELYSRSHCEYYANYVNLGLVMDYTFKPGVKLCVQAVDNQACFGDSGGPLFEVIDGRAVQVGITSHLTANMISTFLLSRHCSGAEPVVYTQVSAYIDWIDTVLNAEKTDQNLIDYGKCDPKMPFRVIRR